MSKLVSVIMGVYNEDKVWLYESIDSILNQTYRNLEFIIILDNPKNKELEEYLKEYQEKDNRIKFYINDVNLGLVKTLNKAIKLANGEYIARMDADDIALETRLEKQVNFLNSNSDYAMVGTKVSYINEAGNEMSIKDKRVIEYAEIKEFLKFGNAIAHPSMVYRKDAVLKLNGYNDALYAEDYELVVRFIANGYKICNLSEALLKYRLRDSGISLSKGIMQITTTQFIQDRYKKFITNNSYNFSEEELKRFIDINTKGDETYNKCETLGREGKKIKKKVLSVYCLLSSKKYFNYFKNRYHMKKLSEQSNK